jgi:Trypsin
MRRLPSGSQRSVASSAIAASFFLTACGGTPADSPEPTRGAILGGELDADHPAVVGLTITHGDGSLGICSGTIIFVEGRSALVLTAAHCVAELDAAGAVKTPVVVLPASSLDVTGGGFIAQDRMLGRTFHAVAVSVADGYDGFIGSPDDVAIVRIVGATAALPRLSALTAAQDHLQAGAPVTLVGFGDAEMPDSFGFRRVTQKVVAWLNPQFIGFDQTDGHGLCEGDSGGPVLVSLDGAAAVAGVASFAGGAAGSPCGGGSTTIRVGAHAAFIARAAQAIPPTLDCASCTLAELAPGNACGPGTDCTGSCADHLRCMDACTDLPCLVACQATPAASAYAAQLENNLSCAAERCAAVCAAEAAQPTDGGIGAGRDGDTHGGAADGGPVAAAAGGCAISPAGRSRPSAAAWALALIAAARGRRRRRGHTSSLAFALGAVGALGATMLVGGCGSVTLKPSDKDAGGAEDAGTGDSTDGGDDVARGPACLTSLDCRPRLSCVAGACTLKERGNACSANDECATGFCADGVCCGLACEGGCVSCNQAGRVGTCWPVDTGKPDPRGICADQGVPSCGTTGACDGFGGCAEYATGAVCAASKCVGNSFEGARACDGRGTCGTAPSLQACAPYACNAASCFNACISDAGCAAPAVCVSGSCRVLPSVVLTGAGASPEIGGAYADPTVEDDCPAGTAVVGFDAAATSDVNPVVDRIRTVCGALVVTHAGSVAIEVGATTALAERGTGPGTAVSLRCPTNQVVYGFDGRSGAFVDQLTFHCAPLLISDAENSVAIGASSVLVPVGGVGGSPQGSFDCGPATVAVGTRTLADGVLKKIALLCASVALRP